MRHCFDIVECLMCMSYGVLTPRRILRFIRKPVDMDNWEKE